MSRPRSNTKLLDECGDGIPLTLRYNFHRPVDHIFRITSKLKLLREIEHEEPVPYALNNTLDDYPVRDHVCSYEEACRAGGVTT